MNRFLSVPWRAARLFLCVGLLFAVPASNTLDAFAQSVDCARLQSQIAALDQGNGRAAQYARAAQQQRGELDRTVAYARSLGCNRQQFLFFGSSPPPQCDGLNARIGQMQANLGQLQAAGGAGQRQNLVASYNAYCRGATQAAVQPRQRGFFENLFGGGQTGYPPEDQIPSDNPEIMIPEEDQTPHGGSQAVCVRSCDGGFFPLNYSVRRGNGDTLNDLCKALCPNVEVSVYTRNPNKEIQSAVSTNGTPYVDLPNALKFQKTFDSACTCRPPGQSWVQALSDAEQVLGSQRKGDIIVTPEKAAEMSRPRADAKIKAKLTEVKPVIAAPAAADDPTAVEATAGAQVPTASKDSAGIAKGDQTSAAPFSAGRSEVVTLPDGTTRRVRRVGPTL